MIARVALPVPRTPPLDYEVPAGMQLERGDRVRVSLRGRPLWGVVIELAPDAAFTGALQPVEQAGGPVVSPDMLEVIAEISEGFWIPLGLCLGRILPRPARRRARRLALAVPKAEVLPIIEELERRAPVQARVLQQLAQGPLDDGELKRRTGARAEATRRLIEKGLVKADPLPFSFRLTEARRALRLTQEQSHALNALEGASPGERFLLVGPSGSGKTEVYLRLMKEVRTRGHGALLLEPEISLLPQVWARAGGALGDPPGVYFGGLAPGERWRVWKDVLDGRLHTVVGTRSAVYLPFPDLGLMVMDEEGEGLYKQDAMVPYYHTRDVAEIRAARQGAVLVMGSATPSVESYYRAERGELRLLRVTQRVAGAPPHVRVVPEGDRVLTPDLVEAVRRHLDDGGQVMLWVNRLGYFTGASCRDCRTFLPCRACGSSLVFHFAERCFRCHVCGVSADRPTCPGCGGSRFRLYGIGTERVEHEAQRHFPRARIARLDSETADHGGEVLAALAEGTLDVLVGSQMIGKGIDFPRISLVGAVNVDTLLGSPDFRAGERAFRLLSGAIGRAGRGDRPGEVIVQSDQAEHYSIRRAVHGDFEGFYREELVYRQALGYPPFVRLGRFTVDGAGAERMAHTIARALGDQGIEVLGPARLPARRGVPRWQVMVRGDESLEARVKEALPRPASSVRWDPRV